MLIPWGFPGGSDGKESAWKGWGSIPGLGRSPGEENGYPLQYSCLENSMDSLAGYSAWGCKELNMTERLSLSLFIFMHWKRKWQPTPLFLPAESQGRGSLVGCCLWGRTELDTTEAT